MTSTFKFIASIFVVLLTLTTFYLLLPNKPVGNTHKYTKLSKEQRIEGRFEQEFEATKDPRTGTVPREKLIAARAETQRLLSVRAVDNVDWEERGPNNVGGRTRAILIDVNDASNNTVFAGGVAGGLWKTTNFQTANPNWMPIDDFFDNIAISCIVQEPNSPNTMYFGTGEGWFNGDAVRGMGIWKSTNGGTTWAQLASTENSDFYYVQDLLIDTNGNIYATTREAGVQRSTNGGSSWTQVLGLSVGIGSIDRAADLELAADGDIFVSLGVGLNNISGIYRSATGAAGSWTDISPSGSFRRIELATAPSDANRVYALCQGGSSSDVTDMFKSTNGGNSWTPITVPNICTNGNSEVFTSGQAWYDLIAAVDPSNADILYIGGLDALRSDNGGTTWTQITSWTGGLVCPSLDEEQYVHADHHEILFENGSSSGMIWGTDGGIAHTVNGKANLPEFTTKNSNYNITQFYACAIHPTSGQDYFLAGAQDNGTQQFTTPGVNSTMRATGGDGGFCHIDQDNPQIQITSYTNNRYAVSTDGGATFTGRFFDGGHFINATDYDNTANILYGAHSTGVYFRWNDPAIAGNNTDNVSTTNLGFVSAVSVSPNVANRVYFGNSGGQVVVVNNAHTGTSKTGTVLLSSSGSISSIAIEEGNENHLLVTYSNYGVASIHESMDGGSTWTNIENNLPDMPVRSVIFNPQDGDQAFIGTELGVWSTDDLDGTNTEWTPTNLGLANVRVDMLQYRKSDNLIAAATHGRGLYTAIDYGDNSGSTTCDIPTNMSAVYNHGTQSFTMSWDAVSGATAYEVKYRPIGGTYINTTPTGLTFTASGLAFNTAYEYTVKAICPRGESAWVTPGIVRPSTGMTTTIDGNDPCCIVISNVKTSGYSNWYITVDNTTLTAQDFVNGTANYCTTSNGSYDVLLYVNDAVGSSTTKEITDCNSGGSGGSCPPTETVSGTLNGVHIYQASQTITSDATIASDAHVEFIAGESITLLPDFETQPGSVFYAHIDECSSYSCSITDSLALVALYNATDGPNWTTTWDLSQPFDTWYGVATNSDGCVTRLDLGANNLVGTIPADIGNLTNVDELYFYNNQLTGSIPIELGNLSNLEYVYLYNNQLTGSIPIELGNLSNLVELYLFSNQLTGSIPTELGNLSNLVILNSSNNQLTGSIPIELSNLSNLDILDLGGNQLTGSIPIELGNLSNLTWLQLGWNQLTGVIPKELGSLSNLINLDLYDNQLMGSIPPELGNLSNLVRLYLYDNQLTNTIPVELGNLSNLVLLDLYSNQLTGSIPPELGNLSNLDQLYLYDNQLTGSIPPELGNLSNLTSLLLYSNQLAGSIPPELGNLSNLTWLLLDGNQLTGAIPLELGNLSNLVRLHLDRNQLTGSIPPELGNLNNLAYLQLFSNQLSGCFDSNLAALCNINYNFNNNPNLPGGGDFLAFCSNNTGACPPFTGQEEETAFKISTSNSHTVSNLALFIIPNPVNKEALIKYELPMPSQIDLAIYDMQGKVMQVLHNKEELGAGVHQQLINASTLPSGIYFIRLGTETQHKIIRMTVTGN